MIKNQQIIDAARKAHNSAVEITGAFLEIEAHTRHVKEQRFHLQQIRKELDEGFIELSRLIDAAKILCPVINCKHLKGDKRK